MTQNQLAFAVLQSCARAGVREFVLCAGARNAPLVSVLSRAEGVKTYSFFEERSAAFFALGRMQSTGRPVAVVTTSGTAAAELLPAAIESDYQGLPLLLLTADRPRRYRGSGAPQTIVQPGLFSHYVETSWDIEGEWAGTFEWSGRRPVHVNVCFEDPDRTPLTETFDLRTEVKKRYAVPSAVADPNNLPLREPLILVGGLPLSEAARVKSLLQAWRRPVYLEAPSQLRGQLQDLEVLESSIPSLKFDGVIHIGSVPTLRYWRDLENSELPVYHFSHLPFSGLPRSPHVHSLSALREWDFVPWSTGDRNNIRRLDAALERFPLSEPGWVNWLSRQIPSGARVFLGNSLPIREWDLAAERGREAEIFVNRGTNGIDGLISTFLGVAEEGRSNWGIIGDLSALYDLSGPWALGQRPVNDVNLVVINNGGGMIFHRIFHNPLFENRHQLSFSDWAKMWNWDYIRLEEPTVLPSSVRPRVIEIIPDAQATENFWKEWR